MNILEARRRVLGGEVIKRTAEGNPISVRSLARRYPGITMQGWTEQAQYEGKNLFDISYASQLSSWSGGNTYRHLVGVDLKPNTTYTLFVQKNNMYFGYNPDYDGKFSFYLGEIMDSAAAPNYGFGNTNISVIPVSYTFTTTDNPYYINMYVQGWSEENIHIVFDELLVDVMLVEGNTTVPYEPYTGGAPSPSPDYLQEIVSAGNWNEETQKWEYEVKLTGKNLFDQSLLTSKTQDGATVTNNGDGSFTIIGEGQLGPNGFLLSSSISGDEARKLLRAGRIFSNNPTAVPIFYCYANDADNNVLFSTGTPTGQAIVTSEILQKMSRLFFVFYSVSGETITPVTIWPMVWQYGDGTWEPYRTPQTVTLTSDRPLTKWDKLEKRNGQWGWVYKSAEIVLDGSEDESWFDSAINDGYYTTIGTSVYNDSSVEGYAFSDKFLFVNIFTREHPSIISPSKYYYFLNVKRYGETLSDWRTYLQTNPVTILYETELETFVPLSAPEQEQMNALHTFRPTTVLSNDAGCEMSLTYKTKKSLEVTT